MSVTSVPGFSAAGIACGLKANGAPDLALVATTDGQPVPAAAVFTSNKMTAAPVLTTRAHLMATNGFANAVVLNSGNANAATGTSGEEKAQATTVAIAEHLGCSPDEVLVCSTGLIGIALDVDKILAATPELVKELNPDGGDDAARAIMTTDTVPKTTVVRGENFIIGGIAKGAAMLAPNMATMLAVLTTDAALNPHDLHHALKAAVDVSFNALSVDGCQSTNDTVIVLANGTAGPTDLEAFTSALTVACTELALAMADDAEGATKTVRVRILGATDETQAEMAARKIANSQLVKCSWYGKDPYWGRVAAELGSAEIDFEPTRLRVSYGEHLVCVGALDAPNIDTAGLTAYMEQRHIELICDLGLGTGTGTVLTNDLTHAYIDENMGTS